MRKLQNSVVLILCLSVSFLYACKQDKSEALPIEVEEEQEINSFAELIEAVNLGNSANQYTLVEDFLDSLDAPVIENDTTVYFIYFGEATSVQVAGDFSSWNPSGRTFEKLRDTNLGIVKNSLSQMRDWIINWSSTIPIGFLTL